MAELNRPDGRWARILAALADGPKSFGALASRVRNPAHPRERDRAKCKRALRHMQREGLIAGSYAMFAITDHGRMSFAQVLSQESGR